MMGERRDGGETLIEILLTVVIVGLTFGALFAALAGAGNAGNAQRTSVQSDVVLRNFAEATKAATAACVVDGRYTVTYPERLPTGYSLSVEGIGAGPGAGVGSRCPRVSAPEVLKLTVTPPTGPSATMEIKVSTP